MLSRRHFTIGATATAFAGLAACARNGVLTAQPGTIGYGALESDPAGLLDLPRGFSYRVLSQFGERMDDGHRVPDRADGMGCIALDRGRVALVRNHELQAKHVDTGPFLDGGRGFAGSYDRDAKGQALPGGTTTIIYDIASGRVEAQHLSLVGTIRNCAGGTTPWGSWLTCEEDTSRAGSTARADHGWVFEVPASVRGLVAPVPLKAMGRFNHEAAAVDPRTGIVYLTEDREDGLFYRFLPETRGQLARGGRLQALAFGDGATDSRNWSEIVLAPGASMPMRWIDLDDVESPGDDLRKRGHAAGAALFARGEGVHFGNGELYFASTSGGAAKFGQIFRYRPSRDEGREDEARAPGVLTNFVESTSGSELNYGDNLTVAPNGHLIVCEDQYTPIVDNYLRGVTPEGALYAFARLRVQTEPAGVCFSPDGATMFMNVYSPTRTLAITGPWRSFGRS